MTKIKSAITAGFVFTILLGSFSGNKSNIHEQAFFMPMFSSAQEQEYSCEKQPENEKIIVIDDKNEDVEFCFKITEIIHEIFG